ncbi:MAG: Mut7-C RNAse domain-containing protein, partial [Candidatus Asgardarchaeia archaeon]
MKIIVDSMLGDIVVWLRLGGIDTIYIDSKESDAEILKLLNRNTLLVSGDKELIKCAKRR